MKASILTQKKKSFVKTIYFRKLKIKPENSSWTGHNWLDTAKRQ